MSRPKTTFICSSCNETFPKWNGRCSSCGSFNTIQEGIAPPAAGSVIPLGSHRAKGVPRTLATIETTTLQARMEPPPRCTTGSGEFDRVLGGGLVQGSVVLFGGEPGIGKSTLLLQSAASMSPARRVVYISGEESLDQIQLRADRLRVSQADVSLASSTDALAVADLVETLPPGSVVIVDSIQTMTVDNDGAPGSVSQVKGAAAHLIPAAKNSGVALILVNHVTKDGGFAGPNLLKHMVDVTLMVEADTSSGSFRIVRAEKNRFGPDDEIGIFEMQDAGMIGIDNPSEVFIAQRDPTAFGTVIFPSIEGTRPLLLEIQALVSPSAFGTGRRSAIGWDANRLNMILATLSARLGVAMANMDIYLNVAGGLRVTDPAMDLAVVTAILSAFAETPVPADIAAFGEVGLAGEVRNATRADARIREARKMGFTEILCPLPRDRSLLPAGCHGINRIARLLLKLPGIGEILERSAAG